MVQNIEKSEQWIMILCKQNYFTLNGEFWLVENYLETEKGPISFLGV